MFKKPRLIFIDAVFLLIFVKVDRSMISNIHMHSDLRRDVCDM